MKIILIFAVCFVSLSSCTAETDVVDVSKFQPLKCRGGTYGPSDEQAGAMQACASKYGTEPGQQNPNCIYYCQSEILGLLNSEGLPNRAAYDKFVEYNVVDEYKTMMTDWFRECLDKYGQVDKSDQECKLAGKLNVCTWSIQPKLVCTE